MSRSRALNRKDICKLFSSFFFVPLAVMAIHLWGAYRAFYNAMSHRDARPSPGTRRRFGRKFGNLLEWRNRHTSPTLHFPHYGSL